MISIRHRMKSERSWQAAVKNKTFYEVFTTHFYTAPATEQHPDGFTFWSTMFKNMTDEAVNGGEIIGGKTGYTDEAGHCLASAAKIDGRILYSRDSRMGAGHRFGDVSYQ